MAVRSSKTGVFNMKRQCTGEDVSCIVYTGNQSIKNQPVLWVIHGSGGVSSSEDIFLNWAKDLPITIAIVDSYTGRKVFKHNWDGNDSRIIDSHTRAEDIVGAKMKFDKIKNDIFPFTSNKHYAVGFSDGATTALRLLTQRYSAYTSWLSKSYCLYPALYPYESDFKTADGSKIHIFVGEHDNWTPAQQAKRFVKEQGASIDVLENTHHSFFKPGVKGWHKHVINISSKDLPDYDSDDLREQFGNIAVNNNINVEECRGVYVEYSKDSSQFVLDKLAHDILS
jgi:dienelactone hydrolase